MSNEDKLVNSDPDKKLAQMHGEKLEGQGGHDLNSDTFYDLLSSTKSMMESRERTIAVEGENKVWNNISGLIYSAHLPLQKIRHMKSVWIGLVAAAVIVISIASVFWYQIKGTTISQNIIAQTTDTIRTVTLNDGSTITLGPNSELSFVQNTDLQVTVALRGEAYFNVRSNPYRVFTVQTNNSRVVVVGTRFNLRSFDNSSTVHLIEGEVTFQGSSPATAISLASGQASIVEAGGEPSAPFEFDTNEVLSWANIQIHLDGRLVESILNEISNRFSVKIRVPENLLNEQLGGTLYIGSVQQTVVDLGMVLGGSFNRDEFGNYDFVPDL